MNANDTEMRLAKLESEMVRVLALLEKPSAVSTALKKMSLKEFLLSKGSPGSDVRRTLFIGYFLEHARGMSSFTLSDLRAGFNEAKEKEPANTNLAVIRNITNGHMMEAPAPDAKRKAWVTTATGERLVEGQNAPD